MSALDPAMLNAFLVFAAVFCALACGVAIIFQYIDRRIAEMDHRVVDLSLDPDGGWRNESVRLNLLSRMAPQWLTVSEERAAEFDELFRSGGRPVGALTGRQFLQACVMESVWIVLLAAVCLLILSVVVRVPGIWVFCILMGAILIGGPNQMVAIRLKAKTHAANVTREVPYFLDLLVLVLQAGGNFRVALDTFLRSTPSGSMRREVLLMKQQLAQGDGAALLQLADRVTDPAVEQVIGTIAKGIETGGDPIRDAEQAERLRFIRSENAKAIAKNLNTQMIFVVGLAFLGVILSVFAAVSPMLSSFG